MSDDKGKKYREGIRVYHAGTFDMVADTTKLDPEEKYRFALVCKKDIIIKDVDWTKYKHAPHFSDPCETCQLACSFNKTRTHKKLTVPLSPELINFLSGIMHQIKADPDYVWHEGLLQVVEHYNNQTGEG